MGNKETKEVIFQNSIESAVYLIFGFIRIHKIINYPEDINYIILSIITCVIIFYFKNFSMALGTTERIPMELSVWSPILILTLFCSVGIIQINEK